MVKAKTAPKNPPPRRMIPSKTLGRMMERIAVKLYILDTNVLMHDPSSLFRFEEHDIFIPMMVLEELDAGKKGHTEVARNARQATRLLDGIVTSATGPAAEGIRLQGPSDGLATGRLFLQTKDIVNDLPDGLPKGKADNQILSVVIHLCDLYPDRPVILVSKDINMRIKAIALELRAQDYLNDKVLGDADVLPPGAMALPPDFWNTQAAEPHARKEGAASVYDLYGPTCSDMTLNQFLYLEPPGGKPLYARVQHHNKAKRHATIETITDYTRDKHAVWGSRRGTGSRISRSTCSWTPKSISSRCSAKQAPARRSSRWQQHCSKR